MAFVGAVATVVVWLLVARARRASARDEYTYQRAAGDQVVGWVILVLLVASWAARDPLGGR